MLKKSGKWGHAATLALVCVLLFGIRAEAQGGKTIHQGIFADSLELSGMSAEEATEAVEAYVAGLRETEITLVAAADTSVVVTAGDLGIRWANPELVTDALNVGIAGNVIERYKLLKDLERDKLVLPIEISFDMQAISNILLEKCIQYDVKAEDASLVRENGEFRILDGRVGYALDVETSIDKVIGQLSKEWDGKPCTIALDVVVQEPRGKAEDLRQVQDLLATFTTSFGDPSTNRAANVKNGCNLINGTLLYPGDEFSVYECVEPFSVDNGYYMAASYMNGRVVDSLGGGVCQVSTTLYNAILLAELEITRRSNHSMIVTYVEPSADAAIAESGNVEEGAAKDLVFANNLNAPVYIEGLIQNDKITFNIYGKETRPANREIRYESKVLEVLNPPADAIYADESQPIGYIVTASAHIGYKAQLWKVVLEDGREISREQINSSSYKMVPRSATVGVATGDPAAREEILAAIGTGSVDHVKNVIALLIGSPVEGGGE